MKYKKVIRAHFLNRPNRFLANVIIGEKEEIVHVKNTGRCKELLKEGSKIFLEDCSENKNRKTKYSLIAAYKGEKLINLDSQIPNKLIYNSIKNKKIFPKEDITKLKREVQYKNSRFDIFFELNGKPSFLEVKGVTLEDNGIAQFPDAPTKRGSKHVYELIDALENGYNAYLLFLIQLEDVNLFKLNWEMDPDFANAVNKAERKGVKILVYNSIVTKDTISLGNKINLNLKEF